MRPKERGGAAKVVGISLAVVTGLCIGGVALSSIGRHSSRAAASSASDQSAVAAEQKAESDAAGPDTSVRDGEFEFVVKSASCGQAKAGTGSLIKTAKGQFCSVSVTVRNVGAEAQIFDASPQRAFDAHGQEYDADSAAVIYANENGQAFLEQIDPGETVSGTLIFDLPKKRKLSAVELHDSPFSHGVEVRVR